MVRIRPERPDDREEIHALHELAFGQAAEADLVDALRDSDAWIPDLALAALDDDLLVGHALFTRAHLDSGAEILALAPIGVLPERQGSGIGGTLVRDGLERAERTEFPLVAVLGHAEYYPRFGFRQAGPYGITAPFPVPDEAWMVYPLPAYEDGIRGEVIYPPAFEGV